MKNHLQLLHELKKACKGYWADRIIGQTEFAVKLSEAQEGQYDNIINNVIDCLKKKYDEEGAITKPVALEAEMLLKELSAKAKEYKILCAAHAHIDMNWMWSMAETVAVTLDTFRTMLRMMEEYPEFTFSQSQASVYKIVEEHHPEMLEEIRKRVKEGRWEVTASTWVETDKNMPNGESLTRHILYTKRYLHELLGLDSDSLQLDFEPDTFGHNANVPEILCSGGVKYYYHCRGYEEHLLYKYQSQSGRSVVVYRDPMWYNGNIGADMALHVPAFCKKHNLRTALKVYGVGDHGGGPTRRDIEKIIDMNTWPVYPQLQFGTFGQFFKEVDSITDTLPVVDKELNFIFSGCYTSQSRIKAANRIGEARLNEAEALSALSAAYAGGKYYGSAFTAAWENILFNHFHDILPGSGVIDTREYALGQFQKSLAIANTSISRALQDITLQVNTADLIPEQWDRDSYSEGAGVGYSIGDFGVPQAERGQGIHRVFHIFNTSAHERSEPVEITVWDWPGDQSLIHIADAQGNELRYQILDGGKEGIGSTRHYWGHTYMKLLVMVTVPAYGYTTCVLDEKQPLYLKDTLPNDPRIETTNTYILENHFIKAVFDRNNAALLTLQDKQRDTMLIHSPHPGCGFRLIEEDDIRGMTAWNVGRYMNVHPLRDDIKILEAKIDPSALRQWIKYETRFRNSKLTVVVSLDWNQARLEYYAECDWQEKGIPGKNIPQLNFHVPLAYPCKEYTYDIPFGTVNRSELDMDVPGLSFAAALPQSSGSSGIMAVTKTKYGFRGYQNSIAIDLIRSSYDPDPYPETGIHRFGFSLQVVNSGETLTLIEDAHDYNYPLISISGFRHGGSENAVKGFLSKEAGTVAISCVKLPEEDDSGRKMIIRVYEVEGHDTQAILGFAGSIEDACYVDANEKPLPGKVDIVGCQAAFDVKAYSTAAVMVSLQPTSHEKR